MGRDIHVLVVLCLVGDIIVWSFGLVPKGIKEGFFFFSLLFLSDRILNINC